MALFFDQTWFDSKLSALGLTRAEVASALGLTAEQVDEMWKDQRELASRDVKMLAQLLATTPQEIATRAGISTPIPAETRKSDTQWMEEFDVRLSRLEREIAELKAVLGRKA